MTAGTRHVSIVVERPVAEVYAFAADPENLPRWAAGLAESRVTRDGDDLVADSPMGRVRVRFAPRNDFGVLDHDVTLPDGSVTHNPLRVLRHDRGSEVVFSFRPGPGMSDDDAGRDAAQIATDLTTLKRLIEGTEG